MKMPGTSALERMKEALIGKVAEAAGLVAKTIRAGKRGPTGEPSKAATGRTSKSRATGQVKVKRGQKHRQRR